jgi:hypothetical protein
MSNLPLLGTFASNTNSSILFRNVLINGNFDIWQRGTSFTQNTGSGYGADRWYHRVGNVQGIISRQDNDFSAFSSKYFYRLDNNTASSDAGMWLKQRIEGVDTLAGKEATVSFWAKASSAKAISVYLNQNFGSGGSVEVTDIGTTNVSLTTSWQKFTVTFSVPSIIGKTIGDGNYLELFFDLSAFVNTAFEFDIAQVQLEEGSVASPFEHRPYGLELSLCQRYYEKSTYVGMATVYSTSKTYAQTCPIGFKATKRISPSMSFGSVSNASNPILTTSSSITSTLHKDTETFSVYLSRTAGDYGYINFTWTADAEL